MENNEIKVNDGVAIDFTNVAPQIVARPGRTPRVKPTEINISSMADVQNTASTAIAIAEPVAPVAVTPMTDAVEATSQNVQLKTFPVHDAVVQVLSIDDTPFLRAEKIQAMADAAKAHAKLFELGVMNNQFLLTNDSKISNVEVGALEKGRIEAERARNEARMQTEQAYAEAEKAYADAARETEFARSEALSQMETLRAEFKNELLSTRKSGTKKMIIAIGVTMVVAAAIGGLIAFVISKL